MHNYEEFQVVVNQTFFIFLSLIAYRYKNIYILSPAFLLTWFPWWAFHVGWHIHITLSSLQTECDVQSNWVAHYPDSMNELFLVTNIYSYHFKIRIFSIMKATKTIEFLSVHVTCYDGSSCLINANMHKSCHDIHICSRKFNLIKLGRYI